MSNVKLKYRGTKLATFRWISEGKLWTANSISPDDIVEVDSGQAKYLKGKASFDDASLAATTDKLVQFIYATESADAAADDIEDAIVVASEYEGTASISSSGGLLNLNIAKPINIHTLTADAELQLVDMSGWDAGTSKRLDLYVKVDAAGTYAFSINTGFTAAEGTLPTPSTAANALDRYVVDCIKDLNICIIGLAQTNIA